MRKLFELIQQLKDKENDENATQDDGQEEDEEDAEEEEEDEDDDDQQGLDDDYHDEDEDPAQSAPARANTEPQLDSQQDSQVLKTPTCRVRSKQSLDSRPSFQLPTPGSYKGRMPTAEEAELQELMEQINLMETAELEAAQPLSSVLNPTFYYYTHICVKDIYVYIYRYRYMCLVYCCT